MKLILLYAAIFGFAFNLTAQSDFLNNSNAIPSRLDMSTTPNTSVFTPNVFNPTKPSSNTSGSMIPNKQLEFKQPQFANPNDSYVEKLNRKEDNGDYKMFRKNQYLGDFKSNANIARISYRDFGEVDGDEIKILVNDHVVVERAYLAGSYTTLELPLVKGFNKIDFEALNQGMLGPNTAQFRVTDENGELISANQWNLATGFKATIIIFKE